MDQMLKILQQIIAVIVLAITLEANGMAAKLCGWLPGFGVFCLLSEVERSSSAEHHCQSRSSMADYQVLGCFAVSLLSYPGVLAQMNLAGTSTMFGTKP